MKRRNRIPALIKDNGKTYTGVILRDSITRIDQDTLSFKVARGFLGKLFKKYSDEITAPYSHVWMGPMGNISGLQNRDSVTIVIMNLDDIFPPTVSRCDEVQHERDMAMQRMQWLKQEVQRREEAIKELGVRINELNNHLVSIVKNK